MKRSLVLLLTFSAIVALIVSVNLPGQTAYGATGTATIQVTSSVLNITAGGSGTDHYTVKLTSGTTWGTDIQYKSSSGISATFSVSSGDPTFSGVMTVKVASSVSSGSHILTLYATGDDPAKDTNVTVEVAASTTSSGASTIEVSSSLLNITAGKSSTTGYTVKLVSGTAGNTSLDYQSTSGISASFSSSSGVPTFSGTLTVSVASSVAAGSYELSLYATGTDPAPTTNITVSVAASAVVKEVTLHSEKTVQVNATNGSSFTVSVSTPGSSSGSSGYYSPSPSALSSYTLTAVISPGTYALINGSVTSNYNFTLATFNQESSFPAPSSNYTVLFFWVFEVNGRVSGHIMFVNSTGSDVHITTEINSPSNWTSYTFLGGGLINNGNAYSYGNGSYVFANGWTYNGTSKELVNTQFVSPVPWVFLEPAGKVKTSPPPAYGLSSYEYAIIIVVVIIVIVGVIGGVAYSRRKKQTGN